MNIVFEKVAKQYPGGKVALHELDLTIPSGAIFCLLGTSGSGKTTTLKLINRLHEPTSGRILLGGRDVAREDRVALRRSIGYVIQGGGLFPHLTVEGNMGLVGRLLGWTAGRLEERLEQLFPLFGFDRSELGRRYPSELSGGQNQRVGVARALLADPPVLLMDEPFSALDPVTRMSVQDELLSIQRKLAKTVVMVTHDLDECFRLADRVALMDGGRLEQVGTATDLVKRPATPFAEKFVAGHRERAAREAALELEEGR